MNPHRASQDRLNEFYEERKQAHADLVIADEMKALIENYMGILRHELMTKCRDVSLSRIDHTANEIELACGANATEDMVIQATYDLRCKAIDVVGETVCRPRPVRHAAE